MVCSQINELRELPELLGSPSSGGSTSLISSGQWARSSSGGDVTELVKEKHLLPSTRFVGFLA